MPPDRDRRWSRHRERCPAPPASGHLPAPRQRLGGSLRACSCGVHGCGSAPAGHPATQIGAVIVNAAPRRQHQDICRRLANALEAACGPALAVSMDVDLRLRDIPLLNRRPDAVVYDASLPDDAVLRPQHCVLVVEVMSPGSVTTDQTDKPAEYAAAGIRHYWRV